MFRFLKRLRYRIHESRKKSKVYKNDAEWYCRKDKDEDRYYELFFFFCRKYHVVWSEASEKDKFFIEEVTRIAFERQQAKKYGFDPNKVRPFPMKCRSIKNQTAKSGVSEHENN